MKFGSMLSTQPYLDPCLGMSRTFGADLRKEGCKKVAFLKDAVFEAKILPRLGGYRILRRKWKWK